MWIYNFGSDLVLEVLYWLSDYGVLCDGPIDCWFMVDMSLMDGLSREFIGFFGMRLENYKKIWF